MILLILLFAFILSFTPTSYAITISQGKTAPDFTLLNAADGNTISLSEYKGQVIVLIYWRTGHTRSLLALKDGNDIFKKFKKKGVQVISIIGGSDTQEEAKSIFEENGINYPLLIDSDRQLNSDYGIRVSPTTIVIDKEGLIAYDIPSHPLTYKIRLEGYIRKTLGEIGENELKETLSPHKEEKDKASLEASRLYNLAMNFTQSRMIDMAIDTVIKSIKVKPEMPKYHVLLGFLYIESKETDKALEAFNKAIELNPNSNDAKTGLGAALILKGHIDKAIEILDDAVIANPYPQMAYYELGRAYELKGEKDKSIEMYKKALEKIIKKQILPSSISKCQ